MEFGNLKKRLALGLAGVMAFTMAAPVGLTTGQQASSVDAAEAFTFIASPKTNVTRGDILTVGKIKTSSVKELTTDRGVDSGFIEVSEGNKGIVGVETCGVTYANSNGVTSADVAKPKEPIKVWYTDGSAGTGDVVHYGFGGTTTEAVVKFQAVTPGTATLKMEAFDKHYVSIGSQNITLEVTDPDATTFDIRSHGSADENIITSLEMNNVNSTDVHILGKTSGSAVLKTLSVTNTNPGVLTVSPSDAAWKQVDSKQDFGWNGIPKGVNKSDMQLVLIPNPDSFGEAELSVVVSYLDANNKPHDLPAQKLSVNVTNQKNVLSVEYLAGQKTVAFNTEADKKSPYHEMVGSDPVSVVGNEALTRAINSGYAITLNPNNTSEVVNGVSDRDAEVVYGLHTPGVTVGGNNDISKHVTFDKKGNFSIKNTLPNGFVGTGAVTVVATGSANKYLASKMVSIPIKVTAKKDASIEIKDGDTVLSYNKFGAEALDADKKKVVLSTVDVQEKTLTYAADVDDSYITWKSDDEKVVKVAKAEDGKLTLSAVKNGETSVTATVKETPETLDTITCTFPVKVSNLKVDNKLTTDTTPIFLNAGNSQVQLSASYVENNTPKYKLVMYDGKNYIDATNVKAVTVGEYSGVLKLEDEKVEGMVFVEVSGNTNATAEALEKAYIPVYYNLGQDEVEDTLTGTAKYTKTLGDSDFQLDVKSAKGDALTYTVDDPSVLYVDSTTGMVSLKGVGTAVITAKGVSYDTSMNITVVVKAPENDEITGKDSYSVKVGKSVTSDAESVLGNALTWSSSNTKVATVSKTGVIKGVKAGTANVTATAKNSGAQLVIKVTVSKNANTLTVKGKKVTKKVALKKNKTKKNFTIAAKNAYTVSNAQGTVTYAKKSGNGKITVAKNGKITVKKGIKKGTYTLKVNVTAAGNNAYKAATKVATVKIVIKKK